MGYKANLNAYLWSVLASINYNINKWSYNVLSQRFDESLSFILYYKKVE